MPTIKSFFVFMVAGFALLTGCIATIPPYIESGLGTIVYCKDSPEYHFDEIRIERHGTDSVKIRCRVQKEGTRVRGYLDVAVATPAGEIIFKGSINAVRTSRSGTYTITATGFPFEFLLPATLLGNNTLRLAFHKEEKHKEQFFESGRANYAL